jgi:type I restriction enzyme, R subunit
VLAYVAYALRRLLAKSAPSGPRWRLRLISTAGSRLFLDFVLAHYVDVGVDELGQEKLTPLLRLMYENSISDAIEDLGRPEEISNVFVGFQKYLYQKQA